MAFDLSSISAGTQLRPPRIILLGVEKIGKSTFAAGSDRPFFLPVRGEEGVDVIDVPKTPTCNTLSEVKEWLLSLYSQEHNHGTVVIDSASALEPIIHLDVCARCGGVDSIEKVGGGYGKGYIEAVTEWRKITQALDALRTERGMASIVIGHVKVKRFDDPAGDSYDQYQFDLHEKAANLLYRWSDVILFCNTKVIAKEKDVGFGKKKGTGIDVTPGYRYLYTQKRPAHPGGGRGAYGRLPYELPLSWVHFIDATTAAAQDISSP